MLTNPDFKGILMNKNDKTAFKKHTLLAIILENIKISSIIVSISYIEPEIQSW